jgi:hypothetical protein
MHLNQTHFAARRCAKLSHAAPIHINERAILRRNPRIVGRKQAATADFY